MKKSELKIMCDTYKSGILNQDADKYLMILASNIERQVREEMKALAYDLIDGINSSNKDNKCESVHAIDGSRTYHTSVKCDRLYKVSPVKIKELNLSEVSSMKKCKMCLRRETNED